MKKAVLLLVFVLPVIIVMLVFAIAGFVGRQSMYISIEGVYAKDLDELANADYFDHGQNTFEIFPNVGDVVEFASYFRVEPARANFSNIEFDISNKNAVQIVNGKIHVLQNRRFSDEGSVKITATNTKLTVFVSIRPDYDRFDYFGFDYNILKKNLESDFASTKEDIITEEENTNHFIEINRALIYDEDFNKSLAITEQERTYIIALGRILELGFDTAAEGWLFGAKRTEFLQYLTIEEIDTNYLGIFVAASEFGEMYNGEHFAIVSQDAIDKTVTLKVSTNFMGSDFSFYVEILIIEEATNG